MIKKRLVLFGIGGVLLLLAAFLLAWVSQDFSSIHGWDGFLAVELIAAVVAGLAFAHLRGEGLPDWMVWLFAGAVLLRLALGMFWFSALPEWGYPTDQQQAGYLMYDPFQRDGLAWELAQSDESLLEAFRGYTTFDQYGGLLFLSAGLYRAFGGSTHVPQLILVLTSVVSGLAVLYVWVFTKRLWGGTAAKWAAFGMALYPEAVMLGGIQMREAFTIPLGAALGFLLLRFWQERSWTDMAAWVLLTAVTVAISWAYLILLLAVLILFLVGLWIDSLAGRQLTRRAWVGIVLGGSAAVVAGYFLWGILSKISVFQVHLTETYSGVVQSVFSRTPEILHVPFLVTYGIVRPMLPAALLGKGSSALWRAVGIWRAAGWTVLAAFLLYATLLVVKKKAWLKPAGMLVWGTGLVSMVASYRAGGDLWDNPRYRAGFAAFQLALAAWALVQQRTDRDPLLRRVVVSAGLLLFWVLMWYLPRYTAAPWLSGKVLDKVGVGLITVGLYLLWDWVRSQPPT